MEPNTFDSEGGPSAYTFNNRVIFYILDRGGLLWFRVDDIADILQYSHPNRALSLYVDEEDGKEYRAIRPETTNLREDFNDPLAIFVNESGLFSLILSSQASDAKAFKIFIVSRMIPAIREIETRQRGQTNHENVGLRTRVDILFSECVQKDSENQELKGEVETLKNCVAELMEQVRSLTEERQASETSLGQVEGELQHTKALYEVKKIEEEGLKTNLTVSQNLASVMKEDFSPKVSDEGKWEGVVFFRLYDSTSFLDPYTHYAIRAQARNMTDQIKRLKAKHPEAVEIARIGYHPNAVNKFNLLKELLAEILRSHGNYFGFRDQTYTETQFLQDVRTTNDESYESMRVRVSKQTRITAFFRVAPKDPETSEAGPSGESCPPPAKKQRPDDSDASSASPVHETDDSTDEDSEKENL